MKKMDKDGLLLCQLQATAFENSIDKMDPVQAVERILEAKGLFQDEETELARQYEIFRRIRMAKKQN